MIILNAILFVFNAIMGGLVTMLGWNWFVVPMFGLPQLTLVFAIGFGVFITYMTKNIYAVNTLDEKKFWERAIVSIFVDGGVILMLWIIKLLA